MLALVLTSNAARPTSALATLNMGLFKYRKAAEEPEEQFPSRPSSPCEDEDDDGAVRHREAGRESFDWGEKLKEEKKKRKEEKKRAASNESLASDAKSSDGDDGAPEAKGFETGAPEAKGELSTIPGSPPSAASSRLSAASSRPAALARSASRAPRGSNGAFEKPRGRGRGPDLVGSFRRNSRPARPRCGSISGDGVAAPPRPRRGHFAETESRLYRGRDADLSEETASRLHRGRDADLSEETASRRRGYSVEAAPRRSSRVGSFISSKLDAAKNALDADGDGKVSAGEMLGAGLGGLKAASRATGRQLMKLESVKALDLDGDGVVTAEEIAEAARQKAAAVKADIDAKAAAVQASAKAVSDEAKVLNDMRKKGDYDSLLDHVGNRLHGGITGFNKFLEGFYVDDRDDLDSVDSVDFATPLLLRLCQPKQREKPKPDPRASGVELDGRWRRPSGRIAATPRGARRGYSEGATARAERTKIDGPPTIGRKSSLDGVGPKQNGACS